MPSDDGLGPHEYEIGSPILPQLRQENPEDPVGLAGLWTLHASLKNEELVPEGGDLEEKLRTVLDERPQEGKEETEEEHCWLPE